MILRSELLGGRTGHDAGRALLAQMYRDATGEDMPPICITPRGKPYFADNAWHFSITHTKRRVFCALSRENIGIDAEELDRAVDLRLAEKILSVSEYMEFSRAPDPRRALLHFWVLKEASAKLSGEGLRGYPDHTSFSLSDARVREYDECLLAILEEENEGENHAL